MSKKKNIELNETEISSELKETEKSHGGPRKGAGRPKGSGKYSCPTKSIRIPVSISNEEITEFCRSMLKDQEK